MRLTPAIVAEMERALGLDTPESRLDLIRQIEKRRLQGVPVTKGHAHGVLVADLPRDVLSLGDSQEKGVIGQLELDDPMRAIRQRFGWLIFGLFVVAQVWKLRRSVYAASGTARARLRAWAKRARIVRSA